MPVIRRHIGSHMSGQPWRIGVIFAAAAGAGAALMVHPADDLPQPAFLVHQPDGEQAILADHVDPLGRHFGDGFIAVQAADLATGVHRVLREKLPALAGRGIARGAKHAFV